VSTNLPPAPNDAIRSDLVDYRGTQTTFDRLLIDQVGRLGQSTFGRISAGYFEDMFAGIGGEILTFPWDGRFAVGMEADWVKKRKPGSLFAFKDLEAYSVLGNLYYSLPTLNLTLQAQVGRFLAKDWGTRFTVSRVYDTGAVVGAWYSITDTSHLNSFNQGYNDKGVFVSLPLEMFKSTSDTRRYQYAVSPWTRDVGQTVRHTTELYGLNAGLMPHNVKFNLEKIKE
jgi:hypothetical protein